MILSAVTHYEKKDPVSRKTSYLKEKIKFALQQRFWPRQTMMTGFVEIIVLNFKNMLVK